MLGTEPPLISTKTTQFLKLYFSKLFKLIVSAILALAATAAISATAIGVMAATERMVVFLLPFQKGSAESLFATVFAVVALVVVAVGLLYLAGVTYAEIDERDE